MSCKDGWGTWFVNGNVSEARRGHVRSRLVAVENREKPDPANYQDSSGVEVVGRIAGLAARGGVRVWEGVVSRGRSEGGRGGGRARSADSVAGGGVQLGRAGAGGWGWGRGRWMDVPACDACTRSPTAPQAGTGSLYPPGLSSGQAAPVLLPGATGSVQLRQRHGRRSAPAYLPGACAENLASIHTRMAARSRLTRLGTEPSGGTGGWHARAPAAR